MSHAALKNRSFDDDVVLRIIFVGMNELINAFVMKFADSDFPHYFFGLLLGPTLFLLYFFTTIKQTAFVQDVREFFLYDAAIKITAILLFYFAHDTLYQDFKPIRGVGIKIIYVALWLRILWPCQQPEQETYCNWPTFGPLGLWHQFRNTSWQLCPATFGQAVAAYVGIAASGVAGYFLWRYQIRQVEILNGVGQFIVLVFLAKTVPPRAKRWWQAHLARIEADRAAKEAAERAASAAELAAEKARRIVMQQAQQSVDFEAAKIAAEHHAKTARDEAAQLRNQLANPPMPELPPPDPVTAMLDPQSPNFDVGLYLTLLARQERSKHTGKTKERAKEDIFETLAPIAVQYGVTSKWRTKRDQPNRTLLESCIMAGLVGFGDED